MGHAGKAQTHCEMGHAKDALQHAKAARDDHAAPHKQLVQCQNPALSCGLAKAHAPGDGVQLERAPQTSPIAK